MSGEAVVLTWIAGLLVGFLTATVFFLRRQVKLLRTRLQTLETAAENQDARLFILEQEIRWLSANGKQTEYQN